MSAVARLSAALGLLVGGEAHAQQSCITPVSLLQIGAELGEVRKSLDLRDVVDARVRLDRVTERLPCLDDVLPANAWAEYAQAVSIAFFFRQEEDEMVRWARSATWADPATPWGSAYPEDHPLRRIATDAGPPTVAGPEDRELVPPKGGGVFLSGRFAERPEAPVDVPVFVQVFDRDRNRVAAWFQNGPQFPEKWLAPGSDTQEPPSWWGQPATARREPSKGTEPDRTASGGGFPVVPVIAGGLLLAASGVTYGLAAGTAGGMPELETGPELTAARSKANALVLASGVALAGGVGVVGGGVLLAGGGLTLRF